MKNRQLVQGSTRAAKWPPPKGIKILREQIPSEEKVQESLKNLAKELPTDLQKIIDQAYKINQST
jgi:hypothetical protein